MRDEVQSPPPPLESNDVNGARAHSERNRAVRVVRRLPRLETTLLTVGLLANTYGKYVLFRGQKGLAFWELLHAVSADVAFFGGVILLFAFFRAVLPQGASARLSIVVAVLVCGWSAANMAWLIATGVQIHISVLKSLLHDPGEFGAIVINRLKNTPRFSIPLFLCMGILAAIVVYRLIRPERLPANDEARAVRRRSVVLPALLVLVGIAGSRLGRAPDPRFGAIVYSSHWFALTSLAGFDGSSAPDAEPEGRRIARAGQRSIAAPPPNAPKPHVVMIVLESTALWSTSLGGQPAGHTPALSTLARQGVWLQRARAVVTHTTQSQFLLLTGVDPNLEGDFVEAVLVDTPYESLATILRANGYRSRFSQMVRASFECNPGLVANLGFDSFWAREDARDPSSHLGYFSGDDFKMLGPAFDWMDKQKSPTFMFLMTSAAHHPYEAPAWFGPPLHDRERDYMQTVRYTDAFVGEVVAMLKKRGIFDNTLLCVVADHGEGIGRKGVLQHNDNPYEESLRVPWIISWPGKIDPGRIVRENCALLDVTPTLLSLLGYQIQDAAFEGQDALARLPENRSIPFSGWHRDAPGGFVMGTSKLVYWPALGQAFRFDLATDPDEDQPIALDERATADVRQWIAEWRGRSRISFDPKRYRERRVFDRWQVYALGNMAWCYYVDAAPENRP